MESRNLRSTFFVVDKIVGTARDVRRGWKLAAATQRQWKKKTYHDATAPRWMKNRFEFNLILYWYAEVARPGEGEVLGAYNLPNHGKFPFFLSETRNFSCFLLEKIVPSSRKNRDSTPQYWVLRATPADMYKNILSNQNLLKSNYIRWKIYFKKKCIQRFYSFVCPDSFLVLLNKEYNLLWNLLIATLKQSLNVSLLLEKELSAFFSAFWQ